MCVRALECECLAMSHSFVRAQFRVYTYSEAPQSHSIMKEINPDVH